jgi:hypothetical protein
MDQLDRGLRQHTNEELVRRHMVTRGYGLSGAVGLVLAILIMMVMVDCLDEPAAVDDPSPSSAVPLVTGHSSLDG